MSPAALLLAAVVVAPTLVTADLGGYLERSGDAEFSGEQLVACETPDGSRDSIFEIAQVDGSVLAWTSDSDHPVLSLGPGLAMSVTGDEVAATVVEGSVVGDDSPAYELGDTSSITYLGRDATEVSILRNGELRVVITVDDETEAVLRTQTLDGDGDLYCDRRLISFQPEATDVPTLEPGHVDSVVPLDEAPDALPDTAAGFTLVDTYPVDDGTLSYFSDGFFAFGIVVTDRPVGFGPDVEVTRVLTDGGEYERAYEAGRVTVAWTAEANNLALIGDLPPDLTQAVLDELPLPADRGFLGRIWSRLFG